MNLFVLFVVWYVVIIPHANSVPRHQLKLHRATKLQNSQENSHDPIALEILERKLAQPNKRYPKNFFNRQRRTKHLESTLSTCSTIAKISVKNVFRALNRDRSTFESCFVSFGDQSPLCRTKEQQALRKPRHSQISFIHKKYIDSEEDTSSNEDFFGLFKTSSMAPTDISSKFPIHKRTAPSVSVPDTKSYSLLPSAENATTGPHPLSEFFIPNQTTKELVMMTEKIKTTVENIKQSSTTAQATEERANLTTPQMISHIPYNNYTVKEDIKIVPISATTTFQISSQMMQSNPTSVQENQKISANPQINPNMLYLDGPAAKFENQNRLLQLEENDEDKHEEEGQSTEEAEGEETEDTEETTKGKLKYKERNNIKEHSVLDSLESYSREECERDHQKTCVCSFESVKTDFIRIFSIVKSTKSAMDEISHFDCRHFVPILDQFVLSSNAKPSVLSGNHKPMTVDSEKGPKEIDEKSMDVFVSQSVSEEDDLTHVFVNTDVEIPCFPTSDIHLSPSEADHVSYKWTFGNKKAITEGRITENSDGEGSLSITEVTSGDSENYTCEVEYINPDTGHHTEETFEHVLNVVALPIVTVRLSLHYRGSLACDSSIIQMFKLFMPQQLEDFVCKIDEDKHLCKIEVHSTVCHTESPDESRERGERRVRIKKRIWPRAKREDSMEMSLNYEVFIHRSEEKWLSSENSTLCHAECHLYITFKLLKLLKESMTEAMFIPVVSESQHGTENFYPVQSSLKVKYIFGCMGGYHLQDGFCVACPEHTFSNDGDTECTHCPPHTYQGKLGARKCIPCTNRWIPACNEYIEDTNLYIVLLVLVILCITVSVFAGIYYMRVKEKTFSQMTKKVIPFSSKTSTPKSKGKKKSSKRVHIVQPESTEIQSLLDSTTDDESIQRNDKTKKKKDPPVTSDEEVVGKKTVSGKKNNAESTKEDVGSKKSKATKKK